METYPAHVVVSWIGHSEKVARRHYLQTTDAHFEKAIKAAGGGAGAGAHGVRNGENWRT